MHTKSFFFADRKVKYQLETVIKKVKIIIFYLQLTKKAIFTFTTSGPVMNKYDVS